MSNVTTLVACAAALLLPGAARAQQWNSAGMEQSAIDALKTQSAPAPKRDLTGIWDAGGAGIAGPGHESAPWTPAGQQRASTYTKHWLARDKMPLTLAPANMDMMEMICSPTEVMDFRKVISDRTNNR
jgi:hypothetical protein